MGEPRQTVDPAPGEPASEDLPRWGGVDHLALVTDDMDATVRFYHGVLGMPLSSTFVLGTMRFYSFRLGERRLLSFFERQGMETFSKAAGAPGTRAIQFDHVSFNLPDRESLLALQQRVRAAGVEVTDVVDHGPIQSLYLTDPSGIALEVNYWEEANLPPGFGDGPSYYDRDPVAAVRELQETGQVTWSGRTRLA